MKLTKQQLEIVTYLQENDCYLFKGRYQGRYYYYIFNKKENKAVKQINNKVLSNLVKKGFLVSSKNLTQDLELSEKYKKN